MQTFFRYFLFTAMLFCFVGGFQQNALAQFTFPEKPDNRNFFVDHASMLTQSDADTVNTIASKLLREEQVAIIVVTVPSLLQYGATGDRIEAYATALFNHWGIGSDERNYGVLLLVSRGDRKARIELGKDWGLEYNSDSQTIMDSLIVPEFKSGNYSAGIVAGVKGLDAMARGLALPKREAPWWFPYAVGIGLVVIIGVIISLFKSGRTGWGWALLIALGALIGYLLYAASRSGGSSGSFGGGSSGGGGATGSW